MVLATGRARCALRSFRHARPLLLLRYYSTIRGGPAVRARSSDPRCLSRAYSSADSNVESSIDSPLNDNRVVIVGGGPCGLLMSLYLSKYRVPSVLYERQTPIERFQHPQAHFLNTRTMELLRFDFPSVHAQVQEAMAPVHEWKDFVFCTSVADVRTLARVEHPVMHPLVASQDANGTLLPVDDIDSAESRSEGAVVSSHHRRHRDLSAELSICSVGHLPQHTFCQILHNHAMSSTSTKYGRLKYGCAVISVEPDRSTGASWIDDPLVRVHTKDTATNASASITSPFVVAADGAHSMVRQSLGIQQVGREAMQHLINVHVQLDNDTRRHFLRRPAMLYSVFHPNVIAMVVCHNAAAGEYVIQIPYFPPYQSFERNFGGDAQVRSLVSDIFGLRGSASAAPGFRIKSVKPWAMSALVATEYYRGRVTLVGDAAHVFPPAGGFGMNTGLQDVQNLAWRLAHLYHSGRLVSEPDALAPSTNGRDSGVSPLQSKLQQYQAERKYVAQQNAALSTRNYQRLLQVHKSMYLDEQHPALLCRALDAARFVPLAAKQLVFETGFRAALKPLAALQNRKDVKGTAAGPKSPADWYGSHLVSNLRRVLGSGAGLPLLFPKYELGFSYDEVLNATTSNRMDRSDKNQPIKGWTRDTWADPPTLQVGSLVPHVRVRLASSICNPSVLDQYPHLIALDQGECDSTSAASRMGHGPWFSSSNLPSQLTPDGRPVFVLLLVGCVGLELEPIVKGLSDRLDSDVQWVHIVSSSTTDVDLQYQHRTFRGLVAKEIPSAFSFFRGEPLPPYAILIRPDSHVHAFSKVGTTKTPLLLSNLIS